MKTSLKFQDHLPKISALQRQTRIQNFILLFDERLLQNIDFKIWSNQFSNRFPLSAGESLKRLESWPDHIVGILDALRSYSRQESAILAVGGGTVGDFAGFTASVLKRGIQFINMPSTWLAAIDSAHGGKNGLNVGLFKNQVGTFYPAHFVYCIKNLLMMQPQGNFHSALGEVIKIGLMDGKSLFSKLNRGGCQSEKELWGLLPKLIEAKMNVVRKDPIETKGYRELLNFGHTMGHALELELGLPHGIAVQKGLEFAAEFSRMQKILKPNEYIKVKALLDKYPSQTVRVIPVRRLAQIISQDKKSISGDQLKFVCIQHAGQLVVKNIKVNDLLTAAVQLGWAK